MKLSTLFLNSWAILLHVIFMGRRSRQYSQNRYLLFSFAKMSNWHSQNAQFYSHSQKNVGIRKKCPIRIRQMHDFILIRKKMFGIRKNVQFAFAKCTILFSFAKKCLALEKMSNWHLQNVICTISQNAALNSQVKSC